MYASLGEFVRALEAAGELHRVKAPVSPLLEIAEIANRACKAPCPRESDHARVFDPGHCGLGGKALLFENVEGSDFPLLINAYGSYRRTELGLGCAAGGFGAIAARIGALTKPAPPHSLRDAWKKAKQFLPLLRVPPKRVGSGPCQEVVKLASSGAVDLTRLPLIKCWPLDGDPGGRRGHDGRGGRHRRRARDATSRSPACTRSTPTTRAPRGPTSPQHRHVPRFSSSTRRGSSCTGTCTTTAPRTGAPGSARPSRCRRDLPGRRDRAAVRARRRRCRRA